MPGAMDQLDALARDLPSDLFALLTFGPSGRLKRFDLRVAFLSHRGVAPQISQE
jgi:hypothetical protein